MIWFDFGTNLLLEPAKGLFAGSRLLSAGLPHRNIDRRVLLWLDILLFLWPACLSIVYPILRAAEWPRSWWQEWIGLSAPRAVRCWCDAIWVVRFIRVYPRYDGVIIIFCFYYWDEFWLCHWLRLGLNIWLKNLALLTLLLICNFNNIEL